MSNTSNNVILFFSGLAVGATLGILLAPASGRETREKLMRKSKAMREKVDEMVDDAKQMAGSATGTTSKSGGAQTRGYGAGA